MREHENIGIDDLKCALDNKEDGQCSNHIKEASKVYNFLLSSSRRRPMFCQWLFKRQKKVAKSKDSSSFHSPLSHFEELPDLPLEKILEYLGAEDIAALQFCSDRFLIRCRDYILRGKWKILNSFEQRYRELTGEGIRDIDPKDHTERCIWREIIRQAKRRQIKFHRACVDINRLGLEDIQ